MHACFTVYHYGVEVGYIEASGTNLFEDAPQKKLGNLPATGYFRVDCREADIPMMFLICFSVTRAH